MNQTGHSMNIMNYELLSLLEMIMDSYLKMVSPSLAYIKVFDMQFI